MVLYLRQSALAKSESAFTLAELMVVFLLLSMVMSGLIYGYVQANRVAQWSAMSLAVQSYASQGAEQARAADWRPRDPTPTSGATNGPGTRDELPPTIAITPQVNFMDIPAQGNPTSTDFSFWVTNQVTITDVSINPPLRQIYSVCTWTFPLTGLQFTNTVVLLRAPDQ